MADYQYKTGGSWTDVPDYAHPNDTTGSSVIVEYPEAQARTGAGLPCGAVGLPRIVIRSEFMRGDGWNWYKAFFSNTTDLYVTVTGITAYDPRSGAWVKYTGNMFRPLGTVRPGSTAVRTFWDNVEIIIGDVTVTT